MVMADYLHSWVGIQAADDKTVTKFKNCYILRDHQILKEDILVRDGKFLDPMDFFFDEKRAADVEIDCQGLLLAPGLIDLQINGGYGVDFTNDIHCQKSADEVVRKVAKGLLSLGVTSFCPTLITSPPERYAKVVPYIKKQKGGPDGANILGLHLEGPFIAPEKKGAHSLEFVRDLSGGFKEVVDVYGSLEDVAIITMAPELDPNCEVVKACVDKGVTVALGHSSATLEQGEAAILAGANMITHLFNAMLVFHHRSDPGLVGLLTSKKLDRQIYYGLIADGIHTHPTALRIAARANMAGLCAVSDAIVAMGLEDGMYKFGHQNIEVKGERAVIAGTNTLCGAKASIYHQVRKLRHLAKCSVIEALEAATLHPAQAVGIQDRKGTLAFGADADFILVNKESLELSSTWIAGECVFRRNEKTS